MAENFWDSDTPASKDAFWSDDKSAAQQDLPEGVKPSTAGSGRGSADDTRRLDRAAAPAPAAVDVPALEPIGFTPTSSTPAETDPTASVTRNRIGSVIADQVGGVHLPDPQLTENQVYENMALSRRGYAASTPATGEPAITVAKPGERQKPNHAEDLGRTVGDTGFAGRSVAKAMTGAGEGVFGAVRAGAELVGADKVARIASDSANAARDFETGMGPSPAMQDFGPKSVLPYLKEQGEGAASSLGQSAATAVLLGPRAVIPLLSLQSAGQQYQQARRAGMAPGAALANAVPYGIFEALGEKFEGLDKAAAAMRVLLTKGAPAEAIKSAGEVLVHAGVREVPGEVFTYIGQAGVDLLPGIGLNQNMTMPQFLDGLRDTAVQASMMGGVEGVGGAAAIMRGKQQPPEKTPEDIAREKGFLVREQQAKRLAAAGEKEVAAGMQSQVDTERADSELKALQDQPWASGDEFAQRYRDLRTQGKKPAEAAARAAMANAYEQIGKGIGLNENAFRKAVDVAATLPMDKVPDFFERLTANLVKKGMSQPLPEGTIGGAVGGVRDAAVAATLHNVYGEAPPTSTVSGILDLEAKQGGDAETGHSDAVSGASDALNAGSEPEKPVSDAQAAPIEPAQEPRPGRSPLAEEDLTPNEAGAHAGASSPLNDKTATREQILGGNAPLGHMVLGVGAPGGKADVSIENAAGSERVDLHHEPPNWRTQMEHGYHYGYMLRTEGNDGDKFDLFVKEGLPEAYAGPVYVVDQSNPKTGTFDEHKGVVGATTEEEARKAYLSHYQKGWKGLNAITRMEWPEFKKWVHDGKKTEPAADFAARQAAPADAAPAQRQGGATELAAGVGQPAGNAGENTGAVAPAAPAPLRLGVTPADASPITVRDGVVHIGASPALNFDSGEPVKVSSGATAEQIKQALKDAGSVSRRMKFFGGKTAPAAESDHSTTAAPPQGAGSHQASAATPAAAPAAPTQDERKPEAPPNGGTPSQVWNGTPPAQRERFVLYAGWKKGSPKTKELLNLTWRELSAVQKEKLAAAIVKVTKAAPAAAPSSQSAPAPSAAQVTKEVASPEKSPQTAPAPKPVTPQVPIAAPAAAPAAAANASTTEGSTIKKAPEVSANTVFTDDAAAAARARLKKKLGTLNSGLDPESMMDGITLAGYHIEKGARTFAAYAQAMLADLGEEARQYLKSWYMGVKYDPRAGAIAKDMSSAGFVDEFDLAAIATPEAGPAEAPAVENPAPSADTPEKAPHDSTTATDAPAQHSDLAPVPVWPWVGDQAAHRGAAQEGEGAGPVDDGGVRHPDERAAGADDAAQGVGNGERDGGVSDARAGNLARNRERDLAGDFRAPVGSLNREGSWLTTARRNVDLIELALKIQAEGRAATPQEQAQLSKYVGFGAGEVRNKLFPVPSQYARQQEPDRLIWPNLVHEASWKALAERLDKLPREWQKSVLQSTQYAHYTSENVVRSIWSAVQRLGFTGGKVLEPGAGIGNFVMAMPEAMRRPKGYTGIEMDGPTALIGKLLSPAQNMLHEDFIKRKLPRDFFDLAIGNPPFSQTKILGDPDYEKHGFMLHDFFFAKSIDRVRPGGLLVFVTSKGTMDKQTDRARKYMSDRADLLGAIRLPSTAFEANAGTSVVTDVIFLRKREAGQQPAGQAWQDVATVQTKDGPVVVNEYFAKNPDMVLGQQRISGNQDDEGRRINSNGYGGEKYTVVSYDKSPQELDAKFAAAVQQLPENIYSVLKASPERIKEETRRVDYDPKVKREGVVYLNGNTLMRVESGVGHELKLSEKDGQWMRSYVGLRDLVHTARQLQANDGEWEPALKALNKAYDSFVKTHGPINDFRTLTRKTTDEDGAEVETTIRVFKNKRLLREDYDHALMISLEQIDEAGKIRKSAFLQDRTIGKPQPREVKTVGDALAVSLDERGRLDLEDVASRLHITKDEAIEALGTNVYRAPSGEWQLSDEYLSGDVVTKLEEAQTAAAIDHSLERNIEALKAVQPERLGPSQISVKLGASWVPSQYVSEFAKLIEAGGVTFDSKTESWQVQGGNERSARRAGAEYGTAARSPSELLEAALNSRQVTIKSKVRDENGKEKEQTDAEATTAAAEAIKKIKDKFRSWVWSDSERASDLVDIYNRRFNNIAPRRFDGSHLTLPGVSLRFKLHPHQLRAIWRQIQTGDTYLAHAVGAGKTIEMIAGGMEQKRLGLINKPIYVVPNHMLEQFSNEFMELYPLANIMVADDENFSAERRKQFVAAATLNGPDALVITHSAFERIGVKEESVAPIRDEILNDLENELDDVEKGDRVRRAQLEQQIEAVTQRFDSIVGMGKKDNVVPFEDIGVDFAYVDEAHAYRKLDFTTNQKIKGIDPSGSRRALDMYVKTRVLERRRPGRAFVFASGTPVTNTMGELYTLMRFFQPQEMDRAGISSFDAWARQFGEVGVALEANAAGRYENVTRFSKFDNVPELMSRVRQFMDVLTSEHLGALVKRPDIEGGKPNLVMVDATKALKGYMKQELSPRLEASRKWKPSFSEPFNPDPVLAIISDGRFAALDPRFFGGKIEAGESSKLDTMADRIIANYKATGGNVYVDNDTGKDESIKGSTQIVFYNLGFGAGSMRSRGFNARQYLTKRLVDGGVKRDQILWFDDANTDAKKEAMFQAMRNGSARILIGSAKKMGTGVNVQKRLARLHYFDPPWFPSDVEQPHGRIIRQGNQNPMVGIDWYATKGAYDATMWQMVGRKQRFIDQAFSGDRSLRSMEDMSEASQYEQAAAMASGDPRALQLAGYRQDVERLERLQAAHANEQIAVRDGLRSARWNVDSAQKRIAQLEKAMAVLGGSYYQFTGGTIGERKFDKLGEFGQALKDAFNRAAKKAAEDSSHSERAVPLGKFGPVQVVGYPSFYGRSKDAEEFKGVELFAVVGDEKMHVLTGTELGAEADPVGLGRKLVNAVNHVSTELDQRKRQLIENETDEKRLNKKLGAPFEHQQDLHEKYAALKQLEDELRAEGEAEAKQQAAATAAAKPVVINEDGSDGEAPQFAKNPVWRSDLESAITGSTMKAAPAAGWMEYLNGLGKRGVKPDEIEWSGIRDWLKMQPGKVAKADVLAYLAHNGVRVEEVMKGGLASTLERDKANATVHLDALGYSASYAEGAGRQGLTLTRRSDGAQFTFDYGLDEFTRNDGGQSEEDPEELRGPALEHALVLEHIANDSYDSDAHDGTKYDKFTLRGGENYRELLLTLPTAATGARPELIDRISQRLTEKGYDGLQEDQRATLARGGNDAIGMLEDLADRVGIKTADVQRAIAGGEPGKQYRSGHWDEPNILAHIRVNDRTDAAGKKVLFVEELQSDWAQQGRRDGFMPKDVKNPTDDEVRTYFDLKPGADPAEFRQEMVEALTRRPGWDRVEGTPPVPRGPFVDKTDAWLSLALKRVIRLAAEEGYDRVAFVNGEQSADRYALTHVVDRLSWFPAQTPDDGRRTVMLDLHGGRSAALQVAADGKVTRGTGSLKADGKLLEEVIGKAAAERVMREGKGDLSGDGLRIGGEGMVAFYDKIVPAALNKMLPKFGGGKAGTVSFGPRTDILHGLSDEERQQIARRAREKQLSENWPVQQVGFDVTPDMRELAAQGMPMFARGDRAPGVDISELRNRVEQIRGAGAAEVRSIANVFTAGWKNPPTVHVVSTYKDLPAKFKATAQVRGIHSNGEVWLVAAAHRTGTDALRKQVGSTLAHEAIAHFGLRQILGSDFDRLLTKPMRLAIASGNTAMRELRDDVRARYRDGDGTYNLTAHQEADEMAARAVEQAVDDEGNFRPGYSWLKAVWAKVAQFLRDLGINVEFSRAELHGMLVQAMRNLQTGKRTGGGAQVVVSAAQDEGAQRATTAPAQSAQGELPDPGAGAWQVPAETVTDKVIYELQDGRVDLKRVQQAIAQAGHKIDERFDARLAETLYPGRVARRTENFLNREAKPLLKAMARIGASMDELGDYLLARHAPERNAQIARVNPELPDGGAGTNSKGELMTTKAADAYIEAIPTERRRLLEELANYVDKITAGTRELLVAEGLEKRRTIDAWNAVYEHYVPLFKDEAEGNDRPHPQGMGFTVRGSASKRATGSTKEVTHVLAHVFMQREAAITRAEKNRVGLALYGLALSHPNRGFWTTIKPSMTEGQITKELNNMGVDTALARSGMQMVPTIRDVSDQTGEVFDRPNPFYKSLPGAITLRLNGEDRVLMLNEHEPRAARLAADLKNLDGLTRLDLAGSIVGKATRWLASVNTQYNPAFGLRNVTRDTWGGLVNLGSTPLRGRGIEVLSHIPAAMQGITRALASHESGKGDWARLWQQYQDDGGRTGWRDSFRDPAERAHAIEKELLHAEHNGSLNPRVLTTRTLHLLDGFNTVLENAVRLAAYKVALDKGMSRPESARLGRELTVDFNRKGRATRELSPLYAFFNASVQGAARTIETLKGPTGKAVLAGGFTLGVIQALMLLAADYDEDEIPDFVKARSFIIPLPRAADGTKRFIAIPYPIGLNALPNTGRVLTELSLDGGKDLGKRVAGALGEIAGAFNPLGSGNIFTAHGALTTIAPSVVDPLVDVATNRTFAETPIEREQRGETDTRPGYQRARETTLRTLPGQAYLGISRVINAATGGNAYERGLASPTPERIRYIAETVGGGVLRELEKSVDTGQKLYTGDKVKPNGTPVVGGFYGEVDADRVAESRYYDRTRQLDKLQNSLQAAHSAGDGDAMVKMVDQHPETGLIRAAGQVQQRIAKLNKLAASTIDDREMMKTIDEARLAEMRGLNQAFEDLEAANGPTLGQRLKKAMRPAPAATP